MRRIRFICSLLLILAGMAGSLQAPAPTLAQSRSFLWERWDMVINPVDTAQNRFTVEERYRIRFNGTFRFGSRVIPDDRTTGIRIESIYQDGVMLQPSCGESPGTYCVRNVQEGISIVYYFTAPVTDRTTNVWIKYTVEGGLRSYEGGDQLWWNVVAQEHAAPIQESLAIVNMPAGFAPRRDVDPVVTYGASANVTVCGSAVECGGRNLTEYISSVDGALVVAEATSTIPADGDFELRVQYPHNPVMIAPAWQANFDVSRRLLPFVNLVGIALVGVVLFGGPLASFALYYTRGRDPHVGPVPEYLAEPPSDLPPAVAGALVDERADTRDVFATLIDLGQRGYLVFEEERTQGLVFGLGASSTTTLKRTDKDTADLKPFESNILYDVFMGRDERDLEALKNKFYAKLPGLKRDLYQELLDHGLFGRSPESTRNMYYGFGVLLMLLAGFTTFGVFAIEFLPDWLRFAIPIALSFNTVVFLGFANFMPAKSYKGAREAAKWLAFKRYLQNLEKYADVGAAAQRFDEYLPYAVAFGLDKEWIRTFTESREVFVPIPRWYYPRYLGGPYSRPFEPGSAPLSVPSARDVLPGELVGEGGRGFSLDSAAGSISGGLEAISDNLTDMLNQTSSVLTSQPSSNGSSGSWSGGGGSFSGGGSFGGGGGGGGSAGFG